LISRLLYAVAILIIRVSRYKGRKDANSRIIGEINSDTTNDYAIAIVTFSKRFFTYCLPLIQELRNAGITNPIYVGINGDLDKMYNPITRTKFLNELSLLEDVNPVCFGSFQGLAFMWNRTIQSAREDRVIVLNDDLIVNRNSAKFTLDKLMKSANNIGACLLNNSWSHFAIHRNKLSEVGWFDERLLGIGEEDGDFTFRFEEHFGMTIPSITLKGLVNDSSSDFDDSLSKGKGKYSLFNWLFLEKKYIFGEGRESRMFETNAIKKLPELNLYPSYLWEVKLKHLLNQEDKDLINSEIDYQIKN